MSDLRILAISGSLRRESYNTALLRAAAELAPDGVSIELADIDLPLYNADLGVPEPVARFKAAVAGADGLLIATPEYNYSVPGVLKNAIDWASRPAYKGPIGGKPTAILSASPSAIGGARAQQHLKTVLLAALAPVFTWPEYVVANAGDRFTDGALTDETSRKLLAELLEAFAAEIRMRKG